MAGVEWAPNRTQPQCGGPRSWAGPGGGCAAPSHRHPSPGTHRRGPHPTMSEGCWRKGSFSSLSSPLQARLFTVATGGERQGVRAREAGRMEGGARWGGGSVRVWGETQGWAPPPLPSWPQPCHLAAASAKVTPAPCWLGGPSGQAQGHANWLRRRLGRWGGPGLGWDLGPPEARGLSTPPPPLCQVGPLSWHRCLGRCGAQVAVGATTERQMREGGRQEGTGGSPGRWMRDDLHKRLRVEVLEMKPERDGGLGCR